MKITIDTNDLKKLKESFKKKEGNFFLTLEAEKNLKKILDMKDQIEEVYEYAREKLKEEAVKIEGFKSLKSDKITVSYRFFGGKYKIDQSRIKKIPQNLYKTIIKYNPKTKEISEFVEKNGALPFGVEEVKRNKQLNFKKNEKKS
jgi:uncharacterized protein YjhX (UPF0386 family)